PTVAPDRRRTATRNRPPRKSLAIRPGTNRWAHRAAPWIRPGLLLFARLPASRCSPPRRLHRGARRSRCLGRLPTDDTCRARVEDRRRVSTYTGLPGDDDDLEHLARCDLVHRPEHHDTEAG